MEKWKTNFIKIWLLNHQKDMWQVIGKWDQTNVQTEMKTSNSEENICTKKKYKDTCKTFSKYRQK